MRKALLVCAAVGCLAGLAVQSAQYRFIAAAIGAAAPFVAYYGAQLLRGVVAWGRRRNWLQFNIQGLFLAITVCSLCLALWTYWLRPQYEQRQFVSAVKLVGGGDAVGIGSDGISIAAKSITDDELAYLATLPGREYVVRVAFMGPYLTDAGMAHLKKFPALTSVTVYGGSITDHGVAQLKSLANLRDLHITETKGVTDKGVAWLAGRRDIKVINLTNTQVSSAQITQLKQALPYCEVVQDHP